MYHRQFQQQLLEIEKGTYRPRAPIEHRSDIPSGCHVLSLYPMRFPEDEEDAADSNGSDMSSTSSRASVSYTSFRSVRAACGDQLRRSASSLLSLSTLLTLQPQHQPMTARRRGSTSRAPRFISSNSASSVSVTRSRQEPMATLISSAHSL